MAEFDTTPYWSSYTGMPRFPALDRDLRVDVAVIGGGVTGITAAYLLRRAGRRVALLERARCASIDTCHTTAHLTCVTDTRLSTLIRDVGDDHARAVWDAGLAAIAEIESNIRREQIECDFAWVPGYLHAPLGASSQSQSASEDEAAALRDEADAAARLGFDAIYRDRVPYIDRPGVEVADQARLHPRKYLAGLLTCLADPDDGDGCQIFEESGVDEVTEHGSSFAVRAHDHTITCDYLVIATHTPIMGTRNIVSASLLQTKLALYTSYVIGGRVAHGRVPDALFWDTADPYHYLRLDTHPTNDYDYIIFGGEDHKTGQVEDTRACYARLESTLADLVPDIEVTHRWSGQVIETNDGLPYIGETTERQFAATGFGGNGITFGTLSGMMAADAVMQRPNPWRELFDVGRTQIRGGLWDYLKENKDYPYYLVRDRFAGPEGRSLRAVPRGHGKILEIDGQRIAAYRAPDGSVTQRSPVCTHLGCIVQWNDAERTWDCPCHGSRFTPTGEVIAGPAESPLNEVSARARPRTRSHSG